MSVERNKSRDAAEPAHQVWWALIQQRLEETRFSLPAGLRGVIQFVANKDAGQENVFYLHLDGPKTQAHDGAATDCGARVLIDDLAVQQMLLDPDSTATAFFVEGDFSIYHAFFDRLNSAKQPMTWLDMRSEQ